MLPCNIYRQQHRQQKIVFIHADFLQYVAVLPLLPLLIKIKKINNIYINSNYRKTVATTATATTSATYRGGDTDTFNQSIKYHISKHL